MKILLAHDDELIRGAIELALKNKGHRVETVKNDYKAKSVLARDKITADIFITDYFLDNFPSVENNGLKFAHAVRKINPQIFVILVSCSPPSTVPEYIDVTVTDDGDAEIKIGRIVEQYEENRNKERKE